ncbi:C6 and c2h2 transcription factor [Apiospora arundinis]
MLIPISECISQLKWLYLAKEECRLDALSAFDNTNKGPWGALLFLHPRSAKAWPVSANMGAILTLAALAVGPFTQHLVVNGVLKPYYKSEMPLFLAPGQNLSSALGRRNLSVGRENENFTSPFLHQGFTIVEQGHASLSDSMAKMFTFRKRTLEMAFSIDSILKYGKDFPAVVNNMTESMTHGIHSGPSTKELQEVALHQEAMFRIEWLWLLLLIAFVVFSAVFFSLTMVLNDEHYGMPLWNSSMWPLVFQGSKTGAIRRGVRVETAPFEK